MRAFGFRRRPQPVPAPEPEPAPEPVPLADIPEAHIAAVILTTVLSGIARQAYDKHCCEDEP